MKLMNLGRAVKLLSVIKGIIKSDFVRVSGVMGEMHGLPQKMGQHFTLYHDREFGQYFAALCTESNIEEIAVVKVLEELGLAPADAEIYAQASIGQVYRVAAGDRRLAVKVKYPQVEKKIKNDFRVLRAMLWPLRLLPLRKSGLLPLLEQLETMLLAECDYEAEAENQGVLHRLLAGEDDICVPEVVAYNGQAIASAWVEGEEPVRSPENIDKWFAESYLKFFLLSLGRSGIVHADPHPGNFIITSGAGGQRQLAVVDFGSTVTFTPAEKQAVIRLLSGEYEGESQLVEDLLLLGLEGEAVEMYRPILGDLVSVIFEPFYYPGDYHFGNWRFQYKMNTLLGIRPLEKPLAIPLKPVLLARTIQGLYYYARGSQAVINWHGTVRKYLR
jgi:predicted unusual protein kinase regulating ubiquinone biosynthesis (AarF/ABC1/UbiB family)